MVLATTVLTMGDATITKADATKIEVGLTEQVENMYIIKPIILLFVPILSAMLLATIYLIDKDSYMLILKQYDTTTTTRHRAHMQQLLITQEVASGIFLYFLILDIDAGGGDLWPIYLALACDNR